MDKKGKKSKKEAGQDVSSDKTMVSPEQWCKDHEIRVTGAGAVNPPPIQRFEDAGCNPRPAQLSSEDGTENIRIWHLCQANMAQNTNMAPLLSECCTEEDIRGQILVLAFRPQSFFFFKLLPLRSDAVQRNVAPSFARKWFSETLLRKVCGLGDLAGQLTAAHPYCAAA